MKKVLFSFAGLLFCLLSYAQVVNIPDANFKAYLLANPLINTNGDGEIQVIEAMNFTGEMNIQSKYISDATGIEAFTKMTRLRAANNNFTVLNLSQNLALDFLDCSNNWNLIQLNVSGLAYLKYLIAYSSGIKNIDLTTNTELWQLQLQSLESLDVTKNTKLETLSFSGGTLDYLDLTKNINLKSLDIFGITLNINSLDLSKNLNLSYLGILNSKFSNLDLSKNLSLSNLRILNSQISNLDLSKNLILNSLEFSNSKISKLDLSKNNNLRTIKVTNMPFLTELNVKNGTNNTITGDKFDPRNNPLLYCIQVDDVNYSNTFWVKDPHASFNTSCNYAATNELDKARLKVYPNPVKDILHLKIDNKILKIEIYSANGQLVKTTSSKEINLSGLAKGVYIMKIDTDKGEIREKIIKE